LDKSSFVSVPVVSLDDYAARNGIDRIDGMKIDIEGAEMEAFEGMSQIFERSPPGFIVCELMPARVSRRAASAAHPTQIMEHLASRGYAAYRPKSDGFLALPAMTPEAVERERHVVNVVFAHSRLRSERPELFQQLA
jgi:hypothetical protein